MIRTEIVRKKLENKLLKLPGVVGVSHKNPEIIIYVESEEHARAVPKILAGVPVRTVVVGKVVALGQQVLAVNRRSKVRPVIGGISLGDPSVTAGTLSCITANNKIVSNAHVIAMNWKEGKWNEPGTPILQPGPLDGGTTEDRIGQLEKYVPIEFNNEEAENYADAACGILDDPRLGKPLVVLGKDDTSEFKVGGTAEVKEGDIVVKSGRTTGWTENEVIDTHATIRVSGYPQGWAVFRDVIIVRQPFCAGGDSGSLVFTKDGRVVGLVFAGSPIIGIVCKVKYFADELGLDFGTPPPPVPDYAVMGGIALSILAISAIATYTHEKGLWRYPWE